MKELYLYITQRIHPASILTAIAFDLLWSLFEGLSTASFVGIILIPILSGTIFVVSFGAVTLIQRYASNDEWSAAMSKGLALGIFAAVPYSVIGAVAAAGLGLMRLAYGADEEVILLGKLTRSWREIERILRRLVPSNLEKLEDVINYLYEHRFLSRTLKDQLHELRRQRNVNMHEFSTEELAELVQDVQAMEHTLRTRFLPI